MRGLISASIFGLFGRFSSTIIQTENGQLEGLENEDHTVFYKIPYAKPPIENLRFKKPESPENWTGIRDATKSDYPRCIQGGDTDDEDCLFLNVFTPNTENPELLPVMLWIHGGAWFQGSGNSGTYNGHELVQHGVIVVTIQYRLGALGFLYSEDGGAVGNQGIWDMMASLNWVNKNIKKFGGDKNKVTIFGESAGGQSVSTLLAIREVENREKLFSQGIIQSDPFGVPYETADQAEAEAEHFMDRLGCVVEMPSYKIFNWDCALKANTSEIMRAQHRTHRRFDTDLVSSVVEPWTPTIDGDLLDGHAMKGLREGRSWNKNVMIGHTSAEGEGFVYPILFMDVGKILYEELLQIVFQDDYDAVLQEYPGHCKTIDRNCDDKAQVSQIVSSYLFDCASRQAVLPRAQNPNSGNTFYYNWDHPDTRKSETDICHSVACHGGENGYCFGTFGDYREMRDVELDLEDRMVKYWTNFARFGDPNTRGGDDLPVWEGFNGDASSVMRLFTGEFEGKSPETIFEFCKFWDGLDSYLKH